MKCEAEKTDVRCKDSVTVTGDDASRTGGRPLNSVILSEEDLRALGPDPRVWFDFATRSAGASLGQQQIFIDGMPATGSIPAALISRIAVNADPFSVENTGVDQIRIDVDLKDPQRKWGFDTSGLPLGFGAGDRLARTAAPQSRSFTGGISGPIRGTPLTFAIHESSTSDYREPVFASPTSGSAFSQPGLTSGSKSNSFAASAVYTRPRGRIRADYFDSSLTLAHAGIGAIIGANAGSALSSTNRQFQTSWRITGDDWIERGGLSWRSNEFDATADSTAAAVVVTGQSISGGNETAAETRQSSTWMARDVFESAGGGRAWLVGGELSRDNLRDAQRANPLGRLQLASVDASIGTWFVTRGAEGAEVSATSAALFAQRMLYDSRRLTVRAGLRADWQDGDGVILSPRVALRTLAPAGVQFAVGAGLFSDAIFPDIRLYVARHSDAQAQYFVVPNAAAADLDAGVLSLAGGLPLSARFDPDFTRRRDIVVRAAAVRKFGRWDVGADHTWTKGVDLGGAIREQMEDALVDLVASDRRLTRHQTHVRAVAGWKRYSLTLHYEDASSFDNTDGPLSFPERSADLAGEWAPSTIVSRHAAGAVVSLNLPAATHVSIAFDARSGRPFNTLSGGDAEGLGTYTDRNGLPRNAGAGPSTRELSAYFYRPIALKQLHGVKFDAGIRFENLLNSTNAVTVGQVLGSPLFGRALSAAPGRSVRVWLTAGQ